MHAADEFYLLAGEEPPAGDAPEQYENGVGISAALLAEAQALAAAWGGVPGREGDVPEAPADGVTGVRLLGGTLAAPVLARAAAVLEAAAGVPVRPFGVGNALFGPHVTVTGLLGGAEVLEALRRDPLADGEWLAGPARVAAGRTRPHAGRRRRGRAGGRLRRPSGRRRNPRRRVC